VKLDGAGVIDAADGTRVYGVAGRISVCLPAADNVFLQAGAG
jgi:hypothetical protein